MSEKPILFNTEMVQAILEGRKTQTRRAIKDPYFNPLISGEWKWNAPVQPGDIFWVRETWMAEYEYNGASDRALYFYKASDPERKGLWRPSIHMPREAARIFLLVKDVRCERLQDITAEDAQAEGCEGFLHYNPLLGCSETVHNFKRIWNSTIKKNDLSEFWWYANPWVWVIQFERIEKQQLAGKESRT